MGRPALENTLLCFFNWERFLRPNQVNRIRFLPIRSAQQGMFTCTAADGSTQPVNVLNIARNNGQVPTTDPVIGRLPADIRASAASQGGVAAVDTNVERYTCSPGGEHTGTSRRRASTTTPGIPALCPPDARVDWPRRQPALQIEGASLRWCCGAISPNCLGYSAFEAPVASWNDVACELLDER